MIDNYAFNLHISVFSPLELLFFSFSSIPLQSNIFYGKKSAWS